MIRAGRLRHRVTIQQLVETQDATNQPLQSWTALGTYWGNVENLTGRELATAKQIHAEASVKVTMRDLDFAITEQHQVSFEGRTLGIVNVNDRDEAGTKSQTILLCQEIRPAVR